MNLFGLDYINIIKSIVPTAKPASGNTEIVVRCPFCGDSKNKNHAHFYISVPINQNDLSFYQCKKCLAHGVVDDNLLRKIGCADSNILVGVARRNAEIFKQPRYKSLKSIDIYPLKNKYIREDKNNTYKLNYINSRIGSNFTYQDILDLKIFLNLYDVLNSNRLELTRHKMVCDNLDNYFIGFISYDNSYCGLRKVTDKQLHPSVNKRYINYNLVKKIDDEKNYYVIPTQIDMLNIEPVKIHIAEGQFDILSIYYNINKCNKFQNIYIAAGGKSYTQVLEFILSEIGIINYEIHFYPDKDITDDYFQYNVINKIQILPSNIYIHRNTFINEKDFGVPMNRIKMHTKEIREIDYL